METLMILSLIGLALFIFFGVRFIHRRNGGGATDKESKEPTGVRRFREQHQEADERIIGAVDAWIGEIFELKASDQFTGSLLLTNKRLVFVGTSFRLGSADAERTQQISVDKIRTLDISADKALLALEVNDEYEYGMRDNPENREFLESVRRAKSQPSAPSHSSSTGGADPLEQLEKLKGLHDSGVLSDAEFEQKKRALLERV
ncbi:SHOCT domain-containing protein [Persicimonas caeni]|nr:SHOCT domain-containing protein [Persicimonas caeni]